MIGGINGRIVLFLLGLSELTILNDISGALSVY